jgi:hypothetical protein
VTGSRSVRWTRNVILILFFGLAVVALGVAYLGHLGVAATFVAVLVGGGAPAALYLAWVSYRDSQDQDKALSLADIADQLAVSMREQWQEEADARGLNFPFPLEVSWLPCETPLADSWSSLERLARNGVGWARASDTWAASPEELAGSGKELAGALNLVPTGRLVVLGAPGSGKTMLMIRLLLDRLGHRNHGEPVPVLVSLAAWDPLDEDLRSWLAAQLVVGNPALAAPPPAGRSERTRIQALLSAGLIMPILDGLDEIPAARKGMAIRRINEMTPGTQLVVTCRTDEPGEDEPGLASSADASMTLRAAAVKLCPLDAATVSDYLLHSESDAAFRWQPVVNSFGTDAPVAQALTTPLMISLARAIYDPLPDEPSGVLRDRPGLADPAELCDPTLNDRKAVQDLLFDELIPRAYRHDPGRRWPVEKTESWLLFLADHLERTIGGPDLAWWQLPQAVPPLVFGLGVGLCTAVAAGIAAGIGHGLGRGFGAGLTIGLAAAPAGGLAGGLAVGIAVARWRQPELADTRWRFRIRALTAGLAIGLAAAVAVGLAFGLASGLSDGLMAGIRAGIVPGLGVGFAPGLAVGLVAAWRRLPQPSPEERSRTRSSGRKRRRIHIRASSLLAGLATGLGAGLTVGLPYGLEFGLFSGLAAGFAVGLADAMERLPPLTTAASPQIALAHDRRAALFIGLPSVLGIGLVFGVGFPIGYGILVGSVVGVGFGLVISILRTAWPSYWLARVWLALNGKLPWSLMKFLADAHHRGVLRQVGTAYQFRHRDLQTRLASRQADSARLPWTESHKAVSPGQG